jgi:hypothetical protein
MKTFTVDQTITEDERMHIDVAGRASVCIIVTDEGIIIDVYGAKVRDESAATCGITWDELEGT